MNIWHKFKKEKFKIITEYHKLMKVNWNLYLENE